MAQARVSFIPSFVNYATAEKPAKAFDTSRTGQDRVSKPVTIDAMHYDQATSSIKVFCSDGNLRECRVQRLNGKEEAGRVLWKQLAAAGKAKSPVQFVAAGGFSPDKWFYQVQ